MRRLSFPAAGLVFTIWQAYGRTLAGLAILPVAVYWISIKVVRRIARGVEVGGFRTATPSDPFLTAGELTFVAATVFLLVIAAAAVVFFFHDTKDLRDGDRPLTWGLWIALVAFVAYGIWTEEQPFYLIFVPKLYEAFSPFLPADRLALWINLNESVVAAAAGCVVVGTAAAVARLPNDATAADVARALARVRTALFLGGGLLAVGIVILFVFYSWPRSLLRSPGAYDEFVRAFVLSQGALYVSVLAAMHIPAAWLLHRRAQGLADVNGGDKSADRRKWLDENGLTTSIQSGMMQVAATIAPLFAGPIGQIFISFTRAGS